jgi:hypothetical protein
MIYHWNNDYLGSLSKLTNLCEQAIRYRIIISVYLKPEVQCHAAHSILQITYTGNGFYTQDGLEL